MKKFWTAEKIVSISAILISLGTFASIVYQNQLIQKQQSATVLPYLEIWNSQSFDRYSLILMNNGIGPAFIREIRMIYKDSTYHGDPWFMFEQLDPPDSIWNPVYYSNVGEGRLIPAGKTVEMIGVSKNKAAAEYLSRRFGDDDVIRLEVEYENVYGDRWLVSGFAEEPKLID